MGHLFTSLCKYKFEMFMLAKIKCSLPQIKYGAQILQFRSTMLVLDLINAKQWQRRAVGGSFNQHFSEEMNEP